MLGRVNAKLNVIDQMIEFYTSSDHGDPINSYATHLNQTFATYQNQLPEKVTSYLKAQLTCMYDSMSHPDESHVPGCDDYDSKSDDLLKSLSEEATAMADREDYLLNPSRKEDYLKYLNNQKSDLNGQRERLFTMLGEMDPFTGGILEADQLAIANLSDTYKGDNWLQFSFDSSAMYENTQESSSYELTTASGGIHILFFHIGGSYTHSKQTSHFQQHLAQSRMKAKGKLLRVNIKRPWFKPEMFEDPTLNFVSCLFVNIIWLYNIQHYF